MNSPTTVQLQKSVVKLLNGLKEHPRQSYNELILHMAKALLKAKRGSHYDEFLHEVQREKMKELWDNKADEVWDNV